MPLLCDRLRPNSFKKLHFHQQQAERFQSMIDSSGGDFPNLLIYGPSGSGKKTRIACVLRELFGSSAFKTKIELKTIQVNPSKKIDIRVISSNHHMEVDPSECGPFQDRFVVQHLIKEFQQSKSVLSVASGSGSSGGSDLKLLVVHEAHKLSKDAQHSLRRTIEKYAVTTRIVLCAETLSTIIDPIQSRCLSIRISRPSQTELTSYLCDVVKKEFNSSSALTKELCEQIVVENERNIRRCLLALETIKVKMSNTSNVSPLVTKSSLELFLRAMADKIFNSVINRGSIKVIEDLRNDFYQLQIHLIPVSYIFLYLLRFCLNKISTSNCKRNKEMRIKLIEFASKYELNAKQGSKAVFHFEAFVASFIAYFN